MNEIRYELSYEDYHSFYSIFMDWRHYGDNWLVCDERVFEAINYALCYVVPTHPDCQPKDQANFANLVSISRSLGIYSWFGPDWANQVEALCAAVDEATCQYFRNADVFQPAGLDEVSLTVIEHVVQNAFNQKFAEYNPDFSTNGWATEPTEFDIT